MLAISLGSAPSRAADPALVAAAKKEGEVVWYTTLIVNQLVRPLSAAFEKKYGVRVRHVRMNSRDVALRTINEANAGRVQADVVDGTSAAPPLKDAGLIEPFIPDSAKTLPATHVDKDRQWVAVNAYFLTPAVNTSMVPLSEAPRTFEDLLNPKWRGKMAWNSSASTSAAPGFVGNILVTMGEEKGMAYLRKLAGQRIVNLETSARAVVDRTIAGEQPIALQIFNHHTVISAKRGAPIDWIKMEPVASVLGVASLVKGGPHPNAGKLLIDFMVSQEGQKIFQTANYLPANPLVPAATPSLTPEGGNFKANVMSPEFVGEHLPRWTKIAEELFR